MDIDYIDELQDSHQKITEILLDVNDPSKRESLITDFIKNSKYNVIEDFPKGFEWFNVAKPLSLKEELKGKIVLLDFFTYCCINCMHILPDLKILENEFSVKDGLVVIGVHSAKFENEKVSTNILSAIQRYNITHPVINDLDAKIWNNCQINCWPSLVLIGPKGNPLILFMGEGHLDSLRTFIKCSLNYYKSKNEISNHEIPIKSAFHLLPELKGPFLFPGKITSFSYDYENNFVNEKIAISDTGNHRIFITDMDGEILFNIGGKPGFKDGNFHEAQFFSPQGIVFQNEYTLYVADTENHAIRKIDLNLRIVITVAGMGEQGIDRIGGKMGVEQHISSPWDLIIYRTPDMDMSFHPPNEQIIEKDVLIIAMAGTHQIWALFLEDTIWWKFKRFSKGTCVCIAGSGREENRNNSYPQSAAFAQPSGLAICREKKELYIADSESSTIRRMSLVDGKVSPVVGGDKNPLNLFGFGDKDGKLTEAKLQHPLGVVMGKLPNLFVADTYNHKIKRVDILNNSISTLKFDGIGQINDHVFNEPSGLYYLENQHKLFVTDTNNHSIKVVKLTEDLNIQEISQFNLKDSKTRAKLPNLSKYLVLKPKNLTVNSKGGKIILNLNFEITDDTKISLEAPQNWYLTTLNPLWSTVPNSGSKIENLTLFLNVTPNSKTKHFYIFLNYVICRNDLCLPKNIAIEFNVDFKDVGKTEVNESFKVLTGIKDEINVL